MNRNGKTIEIQLRKNTSVKFEREVSVDEMAEGLFVNGYGKRNGETDITVNKLVILDRSYGRMALGNNTFLNSVLVKSEAGWSIKTIRNGQSKESVWPLKIAEKAKIYRRKNGKAAEMKPGMKIVQTGGKCAGEVRLVDLIVLLETP